MRKFIRAFTDRPTHSSSESLFITECGLMHCQLTSSELAAALTLERIMEQQCALSEVNIRHAQKTLQFYDHRCVYCLQPSTLGLGLFQGWQLVKMSDRCSGMNRVMVDRGVGGAGVDGPHFADSC